MFYFFNLTIVHVRVLKKNSLKCHDFYWRYLITLLVGMSLKIIRRQFKSNLKKSTIGCPWTNILKTLRFLLFSKISWFLDLKKYFLKSPYLLNRDILKIFWKKYDSWSGSSCQNCLTLKSPIFGRKIIEKYP